jgi:hypothetical protein
MHANELFACLFIASFIYYSNIDTISILNYNKFTGIVFGANN